ncbi:TIGR04141 family sporadically distributed protein [Bacillus cereus]|nr:TIGR04141 family sporadically distributed protein [Bacillus cereus]
MEFSIYKQQATREELIAFLNGKEMRRIGESRAHTSRIVIGGEEQVEQVVIDYFFKLDSEEVVEIGWANYWGGFFGDASRKTKAVESAFGMIIIKINNSVYAISLGRGHSYANNFADMDFGFDVAEIIHDENSIDIKSVKFLKQSKNKSLTQYNTNSYVTSEIGESHELLVSKIDIAEKYSNFLLYSYEEKMKFGAAVKIESSTYMPEDVINIIHELHYIALNGEKSGSLPRMNFVKNNEDHQPMISDLNRGLLDALKNREPSVSLSYYLEEDGDIIIEPTNGGQVEIIYDRRSHILDSFSIDSIGQKLSEIECSDISKVSIRPVNDRRNQRDLLKILDYSTEYRRKDYCLYKGKWASFNKSYIEFIERQIVRVNECTTINYDYNLTDEVLDKGKEIQASDPDEYDQVTYAEYPYNIFLKDKFNFVLLDRKKGQHFYKSVEFADLFDEEEQSLIHVKIGGTPDLRYCIQQSIHSAEIFNTQSDALEVHDIHKVRRVTMLLVLKSENMFLENGTIDFSRNNSIYFKIEIIDWLTKVRMLGYIPEIIIAKDLRGNVSNPVEEVRMAG